MQMITFSTEWGHYNNFVRLTSAMLLVIALLKIIRYYGNTITALVINKVVVTRKVLASQPVETLRKQRNHRADTLTQCQREKAFYHKWLRYCMSVPQDKLYQSCDIAIAFFDFRG